MSYQGTNQEVKELVALISMTGELFKEKYESLIEQEQGGEEVQAALATRSSFVKRAAEEVTKDELRTKVLELREKIRAQIPKTIDGVEKDMFKSNVNNVILSMSNLLGGELTLILSDFVIR